MVGGRSRDQEDRGSLVGVMVLLGIFKSDAVLVSFANLLSELFSIQRR